MVGYHVYEFAGGSPKYKGYEVESVDQWKSPIGLHGGVRKGWWKGGLEGRPSTGGEMSEMHYDLTFAVRAFAVSLTYLYFADSDTNYSDGPSFKHEASGFGGMFSYAVLPILSLDAMFARVSGPLKFSGGMSEMSSDMGANRIALGTTIRVLPIVGLKLDLNRIGGVVNYGGQDMSWGAWGFSVEGIISLF